MQGHKRRGFLFYASSRYRTALTVWAVLSILAWMLFRNRPPAEALQLWHLVVATLLAGFSFLAGLFAWVLFAPLTGRRSQEEIPVARFLGGLATITPPAFIGMALLPAGTSIAPWFGGLLFFLSFMLLLSPTLEVFFAMESRQLAMADNSVDWNRIYDDPSTFRTDFARLQHVTIREPVRRFTSARHREKADTVPMRRDIRDHRSSPRPAQIQPERRPPQQPVERQHQTRRPRPDVKPKQSEPIVRRTEPREPARRPAPSPAAITPSIQPRTLMGAVVETPAPKSKKSRKKKKHQKRQQERIQQEIRPLQQPVPVEPTKRIVSGLVHSIDTSGDSIFEGTVLAEFKAGQKRAYTHVPFHPLYETKPEVICEIDSEADVRLRTPVPHVYGMRLEVTRKQASQALTVPIAVLARGDESRATRAR